MKRFTFEENLSPEMEVVEISVEAGFALSNLENIGGENEDQDW